MGLKPGQTNNPDGRPKGTPNKITKNLRNKINDFLGDKWESVKNDFERMEPKDKMMFYEKLLQYGLPKLSHVEYRSEFDIKKFLNSNEAERLEMLSEFNQSNDE